MLLFLPVGNENGTRSQDARRFIAIAGPSPDDLTRLTAIMAKLIQVSVAVGCPIEDFTENETVPGGLTGAGEMLDIWMSLRTDDGRRKVLEYARTVSVIERA